MSEDEQCTECRDLKSFRWCQRFHDQETLDIICGLLSVDPRKPDDDLCVAMTEGTGW